MRTQATFDAINQSADGGFQLALLEAEMALHVDGEFVDEMLAHSTDAVTLPEYEGIVPLMSPYLHPMHGHQLDTEFGRTTQAQKGAVWKALLKFAWGLGADYGFAATWACVDALYIVATNEARRATEPIDID